EYESDEATKEANEKRRATAHHEGRDPYPSCGNQSRQADGTRCTRSGLSCPHAALHHAFLYRRTAKRLSCSLLSHHALRTLAPGSHPTSRRHCAILAHQSGASLPGLCGRPAGLSRATDRG